MWSLNVLPRYSTTHLANSARRDSVPCGEDCAVSVGSWSGSDYTDSTIGKFSGPMRFPRGSGINVAPFSGAMSGVLATGDPLNISDIVIGTVEIKMVDFVAGWTRADERLRNDVMDLEELGSPPAPSILEVDAKVAAVVADRGKHRSRDSSGTRPITSDEASIRNRVCVLVADDRLPSGVSHA